jgi:predicted Zn-dependent protease
MLCFKIFVSTKLLSKRRDSVKEKEVIAHEIGWNWLNHCKTNGCIMRKTDKIEDQTQKEELCNSCKEKSVKKWKMI